MEMTGAAAALNRAPCMMIKSQSSLGVGNGIADGSRISVRPRSALSGGFRDGGHVLYYQMTTTRMRRKKDTTVMMVSCGDLLTEKKVKKDEKMKMKMKKLKLLKGLTKDLSMLSQTGLVGDDNSQGISEAAETLLKHLQEMKSKEKELKKKRKMEKDMIKAAKDADCESESSESSESSDSECGEVVDLGNLRMMRSSTQWTAPKGHSEVDSCVALQSIIPLQLEEGASLTQANGFGNLGLMSVLEKESTNLHLCSEAVTRELNTSCNPVIAAETSPEKKVEVCMGGKCKKSGAARLVEEFEKVVGEGSVVGCKCMGKCRDGPNVRVFQESLMSPPPLCIGVGLEDVAVIVANFLAGNGDSSSGHVGLATAAT